MEKEAAQPEAVVKTFPGTAHLLVATKTATRSVPPKQSQAAAIKTITYESLSSAELYSLISDNRKTALTFRIFEGRLADTLTKYGAGLYWLVLNPNEKFAAKNRLNFVTTIAGRHIKFMAGVSRNSSNNKTSEYFIKVRQDKNKERLFNLEDVLFVNRDIPDTTLMEKEAGSDEEDFQDYDVISVDDPEEIFELLPEGNKLYLSEGEKPIPDKKKIDGSRLWLSLDHQSKETSTNTRSFEFFADRNAKRIVYRFTAVVDTQRYPTGNVFVQIKNDHDDWDEFVVKKKYRREKKADVPKSKKAEKRQREEESAAAKIVPVDQTAIFDTLRVARADKREIILRTFDCSLREKIRHETGGYAISTYWVALDYSGNNSYPEDIVTFQSYVDDMPGPQFKAFISPYQSNTQRQGKLLFGIRATSAGRHDGFKIFASQDDRSKKIDEPEEQNAVEDDGGLAPMDQQNDEQPRVEPVVVDVQNLELDDFGLGALVGETVSRAVKKLKADSETQLNQAMEISMRRLHELQAESARAQQQEASERRRAEKAIGDVELSQGEVSVLKAKLIVAQSEVSLAEKRLEQRPAVIESDQTSFAELQARHDRAVAEAQHFSEQNVHLTTNYGKVLGDFLEADRERTTLREQTQRLEQYRQNLETELVRQQTIRAQQPPAPVPISHTEALIKYIETHESTLEKEARAQLYEEVKERLNNQLRVDAYLEIVNQSPEIRNMVEGGIATAIEEQNKQAGSS